MPFFFFPRSPAMGNAAGMDEDRRSSVASSTGTARESVSSESGIAAAPAAKAPSVQSAQSPAEEQKKKEEQSGSTSRPGVSSPSAPSSRLYGELAGDSLKAAAVENGLQTNAIYWEFGHRTYLPFWSSFRQKFNPKIIDDAARRFFGLVEEESSEPYVFYGNQPILRHYNGDPSLYTTAPLEQPHRFVLSPTGTSDLSASGASRAAKARRCEGIDVFSAVVKSAFQLDLSHRLATELSLGTGDVTAPVA